ncbi:Epoxide hydrolase [Rhodococcus sp. RD6.2]|uniref:limonene-1,2-epoxide hydrolase family protein n=1 Tax=Rhodococcus sp. RD6.2 TaxID=260936 RepID=UPI00063BBE9F|nr:limonene-1,2-epoxide hydrolase family protein [Rhodococcus sp. RD6.2]CRK50057.1 Epoxide hydrolase [Rhodococcus sp. RD6.2]
MNADSIVTEFCARWKDADAATLAEYFTEDAVYHNIPMAPVVGKDAIKDFLTGFLGQFGGIDFRVHRQVSGGSVVMNERTDVFTINGTTIELPVMGVFEVTDEGKIAGWRDYFDMAPLSALG